MAALCLKQVKNRKRFPATVVLFAIAQEKGHRGSTPDGLVGSNDEMQTAFGLFERGKQFKAHNSVPNLNLD
jgi:hypothetical protein